MTVVQEDTKNFNDEREQGKQLERVERRRGESKQATKLIERWGWIEEAVVPSRIIIQTGNRHSEKIMIWVKISCF